MVFFFIFLDSIPFYFFEKITFKTQLGLVSVYCWICINHEKTRPLLLLLYGFFIDLFGHYIFGISSLILLILFFLQRGNSEILKSSFFKQTWLNFLIFLIFYNTIYCTSLIFLFQNATINFWEIIISMLISNLFFPVLFSAVNFINEKMNIYNE